VTQVDGFRAFFGNCARELTLEGMQITSNRYRVLSLFVLAVTFLVLVIIAPDVLLVIFAGILFSVFFSGGGEWIARHSGLPRGAGIAIFVTLIVATLIGGIMAFAPAIADQFD